MAIKKIRSSFIDTGSTSTQVAVGDHIHSEYMLSGSQSQAFLAGPFNTVVYLAAGDSGGNMTTVGGQYGLALGGRSIFYLNLKIGDVIKMIVGESTLGIYDENTNPTGAIWITDYGYGCGGAGGSAFMVNDVLVAINGGAGGTGMVNHGGYGGAYGERGGDGGSQYEFQGGRGGYYGHGGSGGQFNSDALGITGAMPGYGGPGKYNYGATPIMSSWANTAYDSNPGTGMEGFKATNYTTSTGGIGHASSNLYLGGGGGGGHGGVYSPGGGGGGYGGGGGAGSNNNAGHNYAAGAGGGSLGGGGAYVWSGAGGYGGGGAGGPGCGGGGGGYGGGGGATGGNAIYDSGGGGGGSYQISNLYTNRNYLISSNESHLRILQTDFWNPSIIKPGYAISGNHRVVGDCSLIVIKHTIGGVTKTMKFYPERYVQTYTVTN